YACANFAAVTRRGLDPHDPGAHLAEKHLECGRRRSSLDRRGLPGDARGPATNENDSHTAETGKEAGADHSGSQVTDCATVVQKNVWQKCARHRPFNRFRSLAPRIWTST